MNKKITIGYITPRFFHGLHLCYYKGILEGVRQYNTNLICFSGALHENSYENSEEANKIFNLVSDKNVDGIICWTTGLFQKNPYIKLDELVEKIKSIPFVGIGQQVKNYPCVHPDNNISISLIMSHLIETHNFKKLAFIRGPEYHKPVPICSPHSWLPKN